MERFAPWRHKTDLENVSLTICISSPRDMLQIYTALDKARNPEPAKPVTVGTDEDVKAMEAWLDE